MLKLKGRNEIEKSILRVSEQYILKENRSSWGEEWFDEAYLSYFLFTQSARLFYTYWRIQKKIDFGLISEIVDFGSGPSTARLAFHNFWGKLDEQIRWTNIDSSTLALNYGKRLEQNWGLKSRFQVSNSIPESTSAKQLLILSFANCEGLELEKALSYNQVLILEPGQQAFSKKLIEFREKALNLKFSALAPCPHQEICPMSIGNKSWCHDTAPKPEHINSFDLPFSKNRLNFSYLFLTRTTEVQNIGYSRVVGDLRVEKGKTKVAICRGSSPEFLSWLKKSKLELQLNRGDLIKLPKQLKTKGQEVRIEEAITKIL